jgi:transposase InsO family protein
VPQDEWLVDSGATHHMTKTKTDVGRRTERSVSHVRLGNGHRVECTDEGIVQVPHCTNGSRGGTLVLDRTLVVPGLEKKLISVYGLCQSGYNVLFDSTDMSCRITRGTSTIEAVLDGRLWVLRQSHMVKVKDEDVALKKDAGTHFTRGPQSLQTWHLRMNHVNVGALRRMAKEKKVFGLELKEESIEIPPCVGCAYGKHSREPFRTKTPDGRKKKLLELVHTDLCGPMEVPTVQGGKWYILTFIDDATRRSWVYLLGKKDETYETFLTFKANVEKQSDHKIKILRSDGGGEYIGGQFQDFLKQEGIEHQLTMPDSPEQNGVAERYNRTLIEGVRAMLHGAKMSKGFWGEAVLCFNYTRNRTWVKGSAEDVTPYEGWTGHVPSVVHLRPFGCPVMVHVVDRKRRKLDPKSYQGTFLGYSLNRAGYRVWDGSRFAVAESRDVIFFEDQVGRLNGLEERGMTQHDQRNGVGFATPPQDEGTVVSLTFESRVAEDRSLVRRVEPVEEVGTSYRVPTDEAGSSDDEVVGDEVVPGVLESTQRSATPANDDEHGSPSESEEEEDADDKEEEDGPQPRRSTRNRTEPLRLMYNRLGVPEQAVARGLMFEEDDFDEGRVHLAAHAAAYQVEPETYKQAVGSAECEQWREAMKSELESLQENSTYTAMKLPAGQKAVRSKWVYKVKKNTDGTVRYKARLVAKGFTQRYGVDYLETFAPVVKYKSLRMLLALANELSWVVHQMDVTTAFLYGEIDREIYMVPPEGAVSAGEEGLVWRLDRSLYGLKQAPRCWNQRIHGFLVKHGFKQTLSDSATYSRGSGANQVVLALYVDDMLIMSASEEEVGVIKSLLSGEYKMKDLGEVNVVLGMRVRRSIKDGWLTIDQEEYAKEVLQKFGMWESKPQQIPMSTEMKLTQRDCPKEDEKYKMEDVPYRSVIGSLMYLMVSTRPDLAAALSILSRFLANPGDVHWEAAKKVLRYLKGTYTMGLRYERRGSTDPVAFCDANWASCPDTRRSTTGYVFLMSGGAVSWCCRRQSTTAQSSCESEYMAAAEAVREAIWQRTMLEEVGFGVNGALVIGCDSESAIKLGGDPVYHERTKHIDVRMHFLREHVRRGTVALVYVPTAEQVADVLTKPVPRAKVQFCCTRMGLLKTR